MSKSNQHKHLPNTTPSQKFSRIHGFEWQVAMTNKKQNNARAEVLFSCTWHFAMRALPSLICDTQIFLLLEPSLLGCLRRFRDFIRGEPFQIFRHSIGTIAFCFFSTTDCLTGQGSLGVLPSMGVRLSSQAIASRLAPRGENKEYMRHIRKIVAAYGFEPYRSFLATGFSLWFEPASRPNIYQNTT